VKLLPRSSKNQILGKEREVYRVKVTASPVQGSANKALVTLLAKKLRIPKKDIEIVSGKSSRLKMIRIYGLPSEKMSLLLEDAR
jgi:uncharacterized protein (TIGR00251 family)